MDDSQVPPQQPGFYEGSALQSTVDAIGSGLSTAGDYLFGQKGMIGGQPISPSVAAETQALMQKAGIQPQQVAQMPVEGARVPNLAQEQQVPKVGAEQIQQEIAAQQPTVPPVATAPQVGVPQALSPYSEMQKVEKAVGEAEAAKFAAEEQAYKNKQELIDKEIEKQRDQNRTFTDQYNKVLSGLEEMRTKMSNDSIMNAQVDRNRLWNSASTPQKVLGGIAVFLGGLGSGAAGGENQALKILNNAIEQDIAAQKINIENRRANYKQNIDVQENALSHLRNLFKDSEVAENALRVLQIDKIESQLKETAAKSNSDIVRQKAQMGIQELQLKKNSLQLEIQKAVQWNAMFNSGKTDQPFTDQEMFSVNDPDKLKLMQSHNARLVPGLGTALDEQAAKKARDVTGATNAMLDTIDKIMNIRKAATVIDLTNPWSDKHKELTSLSGQLLAAYKSAEQLGTLDNGVQKLIDKIAPNPTGFNPAIANTYKSLRTMQLKKTQDTLAPLVGLQNAKKYKGPQPLTSAPIKKLGE